MDLKLTKESVPASVSVFDGVQEQGIELDYILPDYYPDIFRLIRCDTEPVITEWSVSGGKLTYVLRCIIRLLYCGSAGEDSSVRCVVQQQEFTRTAELGSNAPDTTVTISASAGRINYRAVNKRRLDIRAAVSVKINASAPSTQEIVTDAGRSDIQLRRTPLKYAGGRITAQRTVQLSGEAELSEAQPEALSVIMQSCTPGSCELRLISGKLLAKGEAGIRVLYSCENGGSCALEDMTFSIPYSQVVDIEGADESWICTAAAETVSCEITPSPDRNGQNRLLRCEIELRLSITAVRPASVMAVSDAFSTVYPCDVETADIRAEFLPQSFSASFRSSAKLADGSAVPERIYAVWCTPRNINTHLSPDGSSAVISGMLTYSMAALDSEGMMIMTDHDETFEESFEPDEALPDGASVSAAISVSGVSYSISPEGELSAAAELTARLTAAGTRTFRAVTDILTDETARKKRDGDYAVKLWFGSENEDIWDIAKRCSTPPAAIMEENELVSESLAGGEMLLIPIKD